MTDRYETSPWGPREGAPTAVPTTHAPLPRDREPVSRRRWTFADLVLAGLIGAVFLTQLARPEWVGDGALSAAALQEGRWEVLLAHMFLHGGIIHLAFNLTAYLALSAPVAFALGGARPGGVRFNAGFLAFYVLAGIAGGFAFVLANLDNPVPAVGASGAICGLWGAASRVASPHGELLPVLHPHVGRNLLNFTVMNLVLVALVFGLGFLAGGQAMGGIAWEAHVGGYLFGLLLVPAFQRLTRGRADRWARPRDPA